MATAPLSGSSRPASPQAPAALGVPAALQVPGTSPRDGKSPSGRQVTPASSHQRPPRPCSPLQDSKSDAGWPPLPGRVVEHQPRSAPDRPKPAELLDTKLGPDRAQRPTITPPPRLKPETLVQEGLALLATLPPAPAELGAAPTGPELEAAAFILKCYRDGLHQPRAEAAPPDAARDQLVAVLDELRGVMLLATPCPQDKLEQATAAYFQVDVIDAAEAACDDIDTAPAACVWALRAGGTDISANALEAVFQSCLVTYPWRLDEGLSEDQREGVVRGLAAATIASHDPRECPNFRFLIDIAKRFQTNEETSDEFMFAEDALSGWTPVLKGLDLALRPAAAVAQILEVLAPPGEPTIFAAVDRRDEQGSAPWSAGACTGVVATVLRDAADPEVCDALVNHISRCVEHASLPSAAQAMLALMAVLGPPSAKPLSEAIMAHAATCAGHTVDGDPRARLDSFARTTKALLVLTEFDDDTHSLEDHDMRWRWGESQLCVDDPELQRAMTATAHDIRRAYLLPLGRWFAVARPSPGPQSLALVPELAAEPAELDALEARLQARFRTDFLRSFLRRTDAEPLEADGIGGVHGASALLVIDELAPLLDEIADEVQPSRLKDLTEWFSANEFEVEYLEPRVWCARWLAAALPMSVSAAPPASAWSRRLDDHGFFYTVARCLNESLPPSVHTLALRHVCAPTALPARLHVWISSQLRGSDREVVTDNTWQLLEMAGTLRPSEQARLLKNLAQTRPDRRPDVYAGFDLRELARDLVWAEEMEPHTRMFMACVLASTWRVDAAHGMGHLDTTPGLSQLVTTDATRDARDDASLGASAFNRPALLFHRGPEFAARMLAQLVQVPWLCTAHMAAAFMHEAAKLDRFNPYRYLIPAILAEKSLLTVEQMDGVLLIAEKALGVPALDPPRQAVQKEIAGHVVTMYTGWIAARENAILDAQGSKRTEMVAELRTDAMGLVRGLALGASKRPALLQDPLAEKFWELLRRCPAPQAPLPAVAGAGAASSASSSAAPAGTGAASSASSSAAPAGAGAASSAASSAPSLDDSERT